MPQRYRHESTGLARNKKGIMNRSALGTMATLYYRLTWRPKGWEFPGRLSKTFLLRQVCKNAYRPCRLILDGLDHGLVSPLRAYSVRIKTSTRNLEIRFRQIKPACSLDRISVDGMKARNGKGTL